MIPSTALLSRDGKSVVLVARQGAAHEVEVTTGSPSGDLTEIRTGLKAGNLVITQGGYELEDGAKIQLPGASQ